MTETNCSRDDDDQDPDDIEEKLREELFGVSRFLMEKSAKELIDIAPLLTDLFQEMVEGGGRPDPYLDERLETIGRELEAARDVAQRANDMDEESLNDLLRATEAVGGKELSQSILDKLIARHAAMPEGPGKDAALRTIENFYRSEPLPPSEG